MKKIFYIMFFCIFIFTQFSFAKNVFYAGVAKINITPPIGTPLSGYADRGNKPSIGVHDTLYAQALVLYDGKKKVVLVSCDLCLVRMPLQKAVKEIVYKKTGIPPENIIICATHTHTGSGAVNKEAEFIEGTFNEKIFKQTKDRIAKVIILANENLIPAKIGFGRGEINLTHNRRFKEEGSDFEVNVMRVENNHGEVIGIVFNYATHPIAVGNIYLFSADFPGYTRKSLEAVYPKSVAIFINGAEGDQNPNFPSGWKDNFDKAERIGRTLAGEIIKIMEHIVCKDLVNMEMTYQELRLSPKYDVRSSICHLLINDALLMSFPGEAYTRLGRELKDKAKKSGFKYVWVLGLANDSIGYIVPEDLYHRHPYEAFMSLFGCKLATFLMEQHDKLLEVSKNKFSQGTGSSPP